MDRGCAAFEEAAQTRRASPVGNQLPIVAFQQRDIPREGFSKTDALLLLIGQKRVVHFQLYVLLRGQLLKPRRVVLNWVSRNNGDFHESEPVPRAVASVLFLTYKQSGTLATARGTSLAA